MLRKKLDEAILQNMSEKKNLLIIMATPSKNTLALHQALLEGVALSEADIKLTVKAPLDANANDVLEADAIVIGTTENFGYMSGELKTFFDRIYYPCLEKTQGLPFALLVKAGTDGSGAIRSVSAITTGLQWKAAQPPTLFVGDFQEPWLEESKELGMMMALSLEQGII